MFVRKQQTYEAVQFTGTNLDAVIEFVGERYITRYNAGLVNTAPMIVVHTPGGAPQLAKGDWITRNVSDPTDIAVYSGHSFGVHFTPVGEDAGHVTIAVDAIGGGIGVNDH